MKRIRFYAVIGCLILITYKNIWNKTEYVFDER